MSTRADNELEQRVERAVHRARAPLTVIKTEIQLDQRRERPRLDPALALLLLEQAERAIAELEALAEASNPTPPPGPTRRRRRS